ncbi:hypothetical protein ES288_D07G185200v1 [Gossypium darwinii]|uniref:Uncharacterized protein n=1 Tax=Gossypium darwinii TaxID=34276 RepID=A0A5D2C1B8_GOSDA|nr:hypothetical protein ES288_D07G185200v1 [Gossypium darwinii]
MEAASLSGVLSYTKLCGSSLCYSDDRFSSDGLIQRRNLHLQAICRVGVYTLGENDVVESHHSHAMEEKIGVLLLNLGGLETLRARLVSYNGIDA